ncbi:MULTISPECIES: hypothetical protein [Paracoccaceae]|jgi:hypothetical protein|uniref:hypothetical protein n=1 Tax=Rhodobacterales TaxID=204455 RepID=UPI001B0DDC22|nr:hypothetical protein [Boseongicola sp. H5]MBO6603727.1 hypothetical protein [Roseicyclus sp.]MBO6623392.1 hypothetical protein [Roseicyclus sp.]MBO6920728.1 hypothetical protein [Roseicyclus sp.]
MSNKSKQNTNSLADSDISTQRRAGRRGFLGLMALGGAAVTVVGSTNQAQAADVDNGQWTDSGSCPRGSGGIFTGVTDSDNGAITDQGGYGRGAPYC